ncbi:3'(2'),5'-bisphosphate nucleotidase CysQ [Desulfoluna spongiiphila]|uniref:3'(2'),5'-bisphosphate nucleotidase CysQ n=1 Tax=Desulfoluna spongiiphila TaxID=419481 RepID=UPI00125A96ED|nr:3'(2'),5'-bisphosphate nucleotidase CysQ [Desulfoluna spongiiphila]VVS92354.1 3'(2') 5'-bisphosphate nucleotidase cysq [Desulfoluna spongiiphila]
MTHSPFYFDIMKVCCGLAKEAGNAILRVYEQDDFGVQEKTDESPLTRADIASHEVIVNGLADSFPDIPVLSEESADISWEERRKWHRYFLVDPLDGTKEFIKRNGEFTVNIALVEGHASVVGVVYAPVLDITYMACKGEGAWKDLPGENRVKLQVSKQLSPLRVVGSRSHGNSKTESLLSPLVPYEMVHMGSSLKFCMVADGRADFYPRLGLTSEWDTAAAQCVVEQAGGDVVTQEGATLTYNNKESLLNVWFFVGNNAKVLLKSLAFTA